MDHICSGRYCLTCFERAQHDTDNGVHHNPGVYASDDAGEVEGQYCPACSHPWDYHAADNPKGSPYHCHMSGFSTKGGKPCTCTEVKP